MRNISIFFLVDGTLEILLFISVGGPGVQKKIVVWGKNVIEEVCNVQKKSIYGVSMHSVCHSKTFMLPDCQFVIEFGPYSLSECSPTHSWSRLKYILYDYLVWSSFFIFESFILTKLEGSFIWFCLCLGVVEEEFDQNPSGGRDKCWFNH